MKNNLQRANRIFAKAGKKYPNLVNFWESLSPVEKQDFANILIIAIETDNQDVLINDKYFYGTC